MSLCVCVFVCGLPFVSVFVCCLSVVGRWPFDVCCVSCVVCCLLSVVCRALSDYRWSFVCVLCDLCCVLFVHYLPFVVCCVRCLFACCLIVVCLLFVCYLSRACVLCCVCRPSFVVQTLFVV